MFHTQVHYAGLFFTLLPVWNKEHAFICSGEGGDEINDMPQQSLQKRKLNLALKRLFYFSLTQIE